MLRIPSGNLRIQESPYTPLHVPIVLAALMGLRRSEILALRWECVDLRNRSLMVCAAMVNGEDGPVVKQPKTQAGARTLAIPTPVVTLLRASRSLDARVCPLTPDGLTDRWKRLMRSLGMRYRFHDLRHFHASSMIAAGAPDKYIMADMGHASMDMVRRVYGHVMEDRQREIDAGMEARALAFTL